MTQTANDGKKPTQKLNRPGQRQQERLQRIARRRRRQGIILSSIVATILIIACVVGLIEYQAYTTHKQTLATNATGTAGTKAQLKSTVQANASATTAVQATATTSMQAVATAYDGTPVPKTGPDSPPVVTKAAAKLPDGLQIIDIKTGTGAEAKEGSAVTVEYTGWIASTGKKFDSSFDDGGTPFTVSPLGQAQVITGWNQGLVGVKAGGVRRLIIPAALGYGSQANGTIPANSNLIFDITIIAVK